jgi:quercetin 2,3-dioxygenase
MTDTMQSSPILSIRRAGERGHADHGWLKSSHTFSFADYVDPAHMGFRALRVINDDVIAPGRGFGTHPHRDMEIVTYVLEGSLEHKDSLGTGSIIRPGEVQRMSAGTGVLHSEFNPSKAERAHLLQIWLLPDREGHTPSYEQKAFPEEERRGKLRVVASPDGRAGSVTIHQDALLLAGLFGPGEVAGYTLAAGRYGWIHAARGSVLVNGTRLEAGDAVALSEGAIEIAGEASGEVLVFDLA